ncbi:extracellular solute-binding protein [Paenibacillus sp. GCM10027626]|uniref:extracellular solute-binding protein n=1 Tax=Paenibacillus sp. GCM10027626 TaxID=3273411 RepID=UPI0036287546
MKKVGLIVLSFVLTAVIISACSNTGKNGAESNRGKETNESPSNASNDTSSESPDVSPITFQTYIDFDWYPLDTWGKDDVSKEITKRTGVSLDVTKGTDLKQLQILLATDQLPELIFTSNQVEFYHNSNIVYPWDELIEKFAPEFMKELDPVEIANNTAEDGHFYTLKTHYTNNEAWDNPNNLPSVGGPGLFVREDIMQEIGNPPLESFEDLLNVYRQVQQKYPDLAVYLPHPSWQNAILELMGLSTTPYVDANGQVHVGFTNPDFIDYFKFMNTLYREGLLKAESFTYKPEQFTQIVNSGKVFSASYNTHLGDEANKVYDANGIKAHMVPVMKALTLNGDSRFKPVDASVGWASFFITKKVKDPARAIQLVKFLKSPEGVALTQWGIEGKHYTLNEEGLLLRPEGFNDLPITETGIGPWYFQASGLADGIATTSAKISNPKYSQHVDLLKFRKKYYERNPALSFVNPMAETDEININAKLNELFGNTQTGIIMSKNEAEVEAKFNKLLADAKQIGLDKLEAYMNEQYKKAQARYETLKQ